MKDIRTIYVINRKLPEGQVPDGSILKPFATIEEALFILSGDTDPMPHDLEYPTDTEFISMTIDDKKKQ